MNVTVCQVGDTILEKNMVSTYVITLSSIVVFSFIVLGVTCIQVKVSFLLGITIVNSIPPLHAVRTTETAQYSFIFISIFTRFWYL